MNLKRSVFASVSTLLLVLFLAGCQRAPAEPEVLSGRIFGTFFEVSISGEDNFDHEAVQTGVLATLNEVDRQMSTYRQDSVLNQVNQSPLGTPVRVPVELFYVLQVAELISQASNGAFDTTVGGLVNLWGFGPEGRITKAPDNNELQRRLAQVGHRFVSLDESTLSVTRHADVFIDLSGIAKGFAVDQVSNYLHEQGLHNFLVNIGGDLKAAGMRNNERPWRVGIEVPTDQKQVAQHVMPVINQAMLGSGDYRNYFEEKGVRYSHTIDPTTGRPIHHRLAAVHVIMDNATEADAWATALLVLGEQQGVELANNKGIAAIFVYRNNGEFDSLMTQEFVRHYADSLVVPTVH